MRFFLFLALVFAPFLQATALEFDTFTLDNGLQVVIVPDHRSPVVVHSVWFQAGSADEPAWRAGKTGIAHMLEHMMFKGTDTIAPGEFSKIVARNGGQDNAFTSRDYTAYYQKVATDRLDLMMQMESDRMANLNINDKVFQPERDVVTEERRWRTDSKPINRFFEALLAKHYGTHPYGNPVIGWRKDIDAYTVQDAIDWYKTFYTPTGAVMILVGDVNAAQVKPMVEKHYGKIERREINPPQLPVLPLYNTAQHIQKVDTEVKVPVFYRLYRAPSVFAGLAGAVDTTKDAVALAVMADILGGGSTSRLYEKLVKEDKIATAASVYYDAVGRAEASVDVFVQPQENVTLAEVQNATNAEIDAMKKHRVTHDELKRTKTKMRANLVYAQDNGFNLAYRLGRWMMAGGTPENFDDWLAELDAITAADVQRVAQKYLVLTQSTTGLLVADDAQFGP